MPRDCTSAFFSVAAPLSGVVPCLKSVAPPPSPSHSAQAVGGEVELERPQRVEQTLPEQDRGYAAWSFLLAAAVVEAITWAIPFSFGILIEYYLQLPEIASQPNATKLIPLIGQLASGTIYCSAPLVYPYMSRHRSHIRPLMWLGMTLCWMSLLIASYCRKAYEYLIFQGVLYGIGGGLVYPPCILYMSEWFFRRRGLANGILFAGTAVGGLLMPFILPSLVKAYGLFLTLRIVAISILVLFLPCLKFVRPRLPDPQVYNHSIRATRVTSITLRNRIWWTLVAANIFQGFAFFVPLIYITSFTSALNLSNALTSLAMALLNGSSTAGPLLVGFLSDYFTPWPIAFILSVLSLLCTVVFWGAIGDVIGVMLFVLTYGFVAGGWSTLWTAFIRRISRDDPSLSMSMYSFLFCTRGLGNILSTPISTALAPLQSSDISHAKQGFVLDDGRFARLIVYICACFAVTTCITVIGWYWDKPVTDREPISN